MRHIYTPQQLKFLRRGYRVARIPELTRRFNRIFGMSKTEQQIKGVLSSRKYTCGRPTGSRQGDGLIFSDDQVAFIKANYGTMGRKELAAALNDRFETRFKESQVISFVKNHKIDSGRRGFFKAGQKPWNAGTKGVCKPNSGSRKKGDIPPNLKPLGHERIDKDGYILVKIAEPNPYTNAKTRYKHKHLVVWERENGPVPQGCMVSFVDGDKSNCEPENLMLLTKGQQLYLNRYHYADQPEEIKPSLLLLAKLVTRAGELQRNQGEKS